MVSTKYKESEVKCLETNQKHVYDFGNLPRRREENVTPHINYIDPVERPGYEDACKKKPSNPTEYHDLSPLSSLVQPMAHRGQIVNLTLTSSCPRSRSKCKTHNMSRTKAVTFIIRRVMILHFIAIAVSLRCGTRCIA